MDSKIAALRGHYIVCGFGRVGSRIAEELAQARKAFVVIAEREENVRNITLSARHLNSKLFIVARSNHNETEVKLKLAGANRVVSLYTIGGERMAYVALERGRVELDETHS